MSFGRVTTLHGGVVVTGADASHEATMYPDKLIHIYRQIDLNDEWEEESTTSTKQDLRPWTRPSPTHANENREIRPTHHEHCPRVTAIQNRRPPSCTGWQKDVCVHKRDAAALTITRYVCKTDAML